MLYVQKWNLMLKILSGAGNLRGTFLTNSFLDPMDLDSRMLFQMHFETTAGDQRLHARHQGINEWQSREILAWIGLL